MRKLAWWAVGLGVGIEVVAAALVMLMRNTVLFGMPYDGFWQVPLMVAHRVGPPLIVSGALLLSATVIADAITKAQGTREGP